MILALGLPSNGEMRTETALSIMIALLNLKKRGPDVVIIANQSCMIHTNRERTMADAVKCHADYLIFVDTDMAFTGEAFEKLLDHLEAGCAVVGANYYQRRFPPRTVTRMLDGDEIPPHERTELFEVAGLGCGLMGIDMKIVPGLKRPWFFYEPFVEGETTPKSEDIWFCDRAREAGFKIWCDPTIEVKHIGAFAYGPPPKGDT